MQRIVTWILGLTILVAATTAAQADSLNCRFIGRCNTPGRSSGVTVVRNCAYVADRDHGLRVISISDPAHPTDVGYHTTSQAWGVAVSGNCAYVADVGSGLRILSVSDPAHPSEAGHYVTPPNAMGVAVVGDYVYVADDTAGLQILQFYGAGIQETPNAEVRTPNRQPTIVRGTLWMPRESPEGSDPLGNPPGGVRPLPLDISGRKVLDLHAGPNDVSHLSPGVYFATSPAGHGATQKHVIT